MPIPPNINCAADICCDPAAAEEARRQILLGLGCPAECAAEMSAAMQKQGIAFAPASLMAEIANLADHPGRKHAAGGSL